MAGRGRGALAAIVAAALALVVDGGAIAAEQAQAAGEASGVVRDALERATTEQELLDRMCCTVVEVGGYRAARIAMAEHDEGKTARPVAWAGASVG